MGKNKLISVVMPVFNEATGLGSFYNRLKNITVCLAYDFEFIFVNDGSSDSSFDLLLQLHNKDERIKIIDLSRNFGQQNALTAGIDLAKGDAVILLDVDSEDNPDYIASFIDYWEKGYQVVYARRGKRKVSFLKNVCFAVFHRINRLICSVNTDATGTFCLMDHKVVTHMRQLTETDKYIPGLRSWVGFKQIGIEAERGKRYDNKPRVKLNSLFRLAFNSFTSFSTLPLKISIMLGIAFSLLSFIGIAIVIARKLIFKLAILGWASTLSIILLLGGIQLVCIGLQGEYIARIFNEVKNRPNYIIREIIGFDE